MKRLVLAIALLVATNRAHAQDRIREHVEIAAARFGLPVDLVEAVIAAESGGKMRAVSPAGAMGLMQLMPATWAALRARLGLGGDPFDPADNILAGTAYLRDLRDRYGAPGFLAAYNAGPRRYEASLAGRSLPLETRRYVDRIVARPGADGWRGGDWRAVGLFPPSWAQGLGETAGGVEGAVREGDGKALFVARKASRNE